MYACYECGHKFKTVRAAEKASLNGCPKCGGVDVDLDDAPPRSPPPIAPAAIRCPHCHSTDCRYSGEYAAPGYGACWRCRSCGRAFAVIGTRTQRHAPIFEPEDVI